MDFYSRFIRICNENGISPSGAAIEVGISKAAVTAWKNGSKCSDANVAKIANYFNVPISYFDDDDKDILPAKSEELTDKQKKVIELVKSIKDDALLEIFIAAMEKAIKK